MDDSRIWFYAVLVFFAFVSWLRKRIKAVAEARRQRSHSQQYDQKVQEKKQQQEERQVPAQLRSEPEPPEVAKPPGSLKELFQQVAEEQAKAQGDIQQTKTAPPPLPKPVVSRDEEFHQQDVAFHQTEEAFHQNHQAGTVHSSLQRKTDRLRKRTAELRSGRTRLAIAETFSNRGKLRNAVIFKEILDTPKGLQ